MPSNSHETSRIFATYKRVDDNSCRPFINSFSLSDSTSKCKFKKYEKDNKMPQKEDKLISITQLQKIAEQTTASTSF